jgi:ribonuclease HII
MPNLSLEQRFNGPVCGIDEVGRGPLAGPVIAGCVIIPVQTQSQKFWSDVRDSKQLSARKRDALAAEIRTHSIWALGIASVAEIDQINILQATFLAMQRAFTSLPASIRPVHALVDGNRAPKLNIPVMTVIKGDQISLSIAAASIIAKVERDRLMTELDQSFPGYGWAKNAGYGTIAHMKALQTLGPTMHHRKTFAPIASLLQQKEAR